MGCCGATGCLAPGLLGVWQETLGRAGRSRPPSSQQPAAPRPGQEGGAKRGEEEEGALGPGGQQSHHSHRLSCGQKATPRGRPERGIVAFHFPCDPPLQGPGHPLTASRPSCLQGGAVRAAGLTESSAVAGTEASSRGAGAERLWLPRLRPLPELRASLHVSLLLPADQWGGRGGGGGREGEGGPDRPGCLPSQLPASGAAQALEVAGV